MILISFPFTHFLSNTITTPKNTEMVGRICLVAKGSAYDGGLKCREQD